MDKRNETLSSRPLDQGYDQGNRLDEDEIQQIVARYEAEIKARTEGPQLEGFEGSQLAEALRNEPENVLLLDLTNEGGEVVGKWPLVVPITYHQDYSQRFFAEHYPERNSYYFSLPPYASIEALTESGQEFETVAQFLKDKQAILAYDHTQGSDNTELIPALVQRIVADSDATVEDITPESEAWGKKWGDPLSVHYEGIARLARKTDQPAANVHEAIQKLIANGEVEYMPQDGVAFLGPEELLADDKKILDRLWDIYSGQFDVLIEDHPILGKQPREEFDAMLLDEDTINTVIVVDGQVEGLLYMVNDISKCVWLNKEFYDNEFDGEDGWITHFPGIVVAADKARQGAGYAEKIIAMNLRLIAEMNKDLIITFACSNVSRTYIPKMVKNGIFDSPDFNFPDDENKLHETTTYGYRIMEVS